MSSKIYRFLLFSLNFVVAVSCAYFISSGQLHMKLFYESTLLLFLGTIAFLFSQGQYLSSFFSLAFLVSLYAALACNYAENPNGIWYFSNYKWDNDPLLMAKSLFLFVESQAVFHAVILLLNPHDKWEWAKPSKYEQSLSYYFSIIFILLSIFTLQLTTSGSVTSVGYASASASNSVAIQSSGLKVFGIFFSIVAIVLASRTKDGFNGRWSLFMLVLGTLVMVYYQFLRGERSGSLGFFAVAGLIFFHMSRYKFYTKAILFGTGLAVLMVVLLAVGTIRHAASKVGLKNAIVLSGEVIKRNYLEDGSSIYVKNSREKSGYVNADLLSAPTQMYWHMLNTVNLYDSGQGLRGKSFIDIIPQALPKFLTDPIGYERPVNGAVRLMKMPNRAHGGGMYLFALGYWNLGNYGVILTALLFGGVIVGFEWAFRYLPYFVVSGYFCFLSVFLEAPFYGWQPMTKSIQFSLVIGIILLVVYRFFKSNFHASNIKRL